MFDSIFKIGAPWSWPEFLTTLFFLSLIIFVRYIAMSWPLFWAFWSNTSPIKNWVEARRLQQPILKSGVVKTEIKYSMMSTVFFALPAAILLEALKRGWTFVYVSENPVWMWFKPLIAKTFGDLSPAQGGYKVFVGSDSVGAMGAQEALLKGIMSQPSQSAIEAFYSAGFASYIPIVFEIFYILLSIGVYLFIHDTFYYWFHRWMHKPGIYQVWHQAHHYSTNPTPWAAFAFHPYEALVAGLVIPLIAFIIPIHLGALLFLLTFMTVTAVLNHCGVEVYPKSWVESKWFGGWFIGATHHNLHHTKFTKNYGLYFRFWDRWMKTDVM